MSASVEDYFRLAFERKIAVKLPAREDDTLTAVTRLLEKKREITEVEDALGAQKEMFQTKMEGLQRRRNELECKELLLKESLMKFDKFLKENDAKRDRAIKKAVSEQEAKHLKDKEIQILLEEEARMLIYQDKLVRNLEKSVVSKDYLERVVETAEEFHEIREVIARFDTLTSTHEDLEQQLQENQDKVDSCRKELWIYSEEKHNEILNYNNQLAALQTRLDTAQSNALKWESKWNHIQNTASRKTLELGRIKMAIHNLYALVSRHRLMSGPEEETDADDTSDQLIQVKDYIGILAQVNQELRRAGSAFNPSSATGEKRKNTNDVKYNK